MAKMKKCPICGVNVKLENLEGHVRKVHPKVDAKAYLSEDDKTSIKIARKKERKSAQPFEEQERRRWVVAGGIILAIVIALIIIFSIAPPIAPGCQIKGDEVKPFTIGDVDGNVYDLNVRIGQKELIILEFFSTTCPHCETMAPVLSDLHEYYGWGETVEFASISSSSVDSVQQVRNFRDVYGMGTNMTYIYDSSHSIADDFCVTRTPTTVFIDRNGVIVEWSMGAKNFDQMVDIIEDLRQG